MKKAVLTVESKPDKKKQVTFTVEYTDHFKPESTRKCQYHGDLLWHKDYWQRKGYVVGVRELKGKSK